jgi:glycosyltransferase involved in cell wall biosynthesis
MSLEQTKKIRVLCLDHEGGHGGSSRSLYSLLNSLASEDIHIEVWCKRDNHLGPLYETMGIEVYTRPELPVYAVFSPSNIDNLSLLKSRIGSFMAFARQANETCAYIKDNFDLVHFNHVSFAPLAWYIRKKTGIAATMHIRTNPYYSIMAKIQAHIVARSVDTMFCITENEKIYMMKFLGPISSKIVHNIPFPATQTPPPSKEVPQDNRLKIISLANYHYIRGVDRIVDVAAEIQKLGRESDVLFVMAGTMTLIKSLPGRLGEVGREGGTLEDIVSEKGLSRMFKFLGHVTEPEQVIASGDATIKLTREDNPWGRDIIESMWAGLPVITIGSWQNFVRDGENGVMFEKYNPEEIARNILELQDSRQKLEEMGARCKKHILEKCDPAISAQKVVETWRHLVLPAELPH